MNTFCHGPVSSLPVAVTVFILIAYSLEFCNSCLQWYLVPSNYSKTTDLT